MIVNILMSIPFLLYFLILGMLGLCVWSYSHVKEAKLRLEVVGDSRTGRETIRQAYEIYLMTCVCTALLVLVAFWSATASPLNTPQNSVDRNSLAIPQEVLTASSPAGSASLPNRVPQPKDQQLEKELTYKDKVDTILYNK